MVLQIPQLGASSDHRPIKKRHPIEMGHRHAVDNFRLPIHALGKSEHLRPVFLIYIF